MRRDSGSAAASPYDTQPETPQSQGGSQHQYNNSLVLQQQLQAAQASAKALQQQVRPFQGGVNPGMSGNPGSQQQGVASEDPASLHAKRAYQQQMAEQQIQRLRAISGGSFGAQQPQLDGMEIEQQPPPSLHGSQHQTPSTTAEPTPRQKPGQMLPPQSTTTGTSPTQFSASTPKTQSVRQPSQTPGSASGKSKEGNSVSGRKKVVSTFAVADICLNLQNKGSPACVTKASSIASEKTPSPVAEDAHFTNPTRTVGSSSSGSSPREVKPVLQQELPQSASMTSTFSQPTPTSMQANQPVQAVEPSQVTQLTQEPRPTTTPPPAPPPSTVLQQQSQQQPGQPQSANTSAPNSANPQLSYPGMELGADFFSLPGVEGGEDFDLGGLGTDFDFDTYLATLDNDGGGDSAMAG